MISRRGWMQPHRNPPASRFCNMAKRFREPDWSFGELAERLCDIAEGFRDIAKSLFQFAKRRRHFHHAALTLIYLFSKQFHFSAMSRNCFANSQNDSASSQNDPANSRKAPAILQNHHANSPENPSAPGFDHSKQNLFIHIINISNWHRYCFRFLSVKQKTKQNRKTKK